MAILYLSSAERGAIWKPFWSHPGVILTPHVASETDFEEGAAFCAQAIQAHLKGADIPGLVGKEQRY
jgi:glyoxylate/hydroxypyruvate reductase A